MGSSLENRILHITKVSEDFGKLEALQPLHKIIKSEGEPHQVIPMMIIVLGGFKTWADRYNVKPMTTYATVSLMRALTDEGLSIPRK